MKGSFAKREALLDEVSQDFLTRLVHLGGYCTALQAEGIGITESGKRVQARLRRLERLGFLRRVTKYPVVYRVTKSTTRLGYLARNNDPPPLVFWHLTGAVALIEESR